MWLRQPYIKSIPPFSTRFPPGISFLLPWYGFLPNFVVFSKLWEKKRKDMEQSDQFMKKSKVKRFSERFFRFVEKGFDWIALVVIALIILSVLVFFNA